MVIDLEPDGVAACIAEAGIGFCFAQVFHPAMRHAGPVRRELGVPTVFNFLGPLTNPAGAPRQTVGVSDAVMAPKIAEALAGLGPDEQQEQFREDLQRARETLAERPGFTHSTVGRNIDDPGCGC